MAAGVDAVIAALRVVLDEAQKSDEPMWQAQSANRWVSQLPGAWTGRWRKLILKGDSTGESRRDEFIAHLRAVLAFLEANRSDMPAPRKWWSSHRRGASVPAGANPSVASAPQASNRPVNLLRVRKPMPGVH